MGKEQKTAILINRDNKRYKFIYITFRADGSILLTYPRKNGYQIISDTDIILSPKIEEQNIDLKRKNLKLYEPKITFHPGKQSIHVNSKPEKIFKTDKSVLQVGENCSAFPLCQILIPFCANYLDQYSPKKNYFKPLDITLSNTNATLSVLIWGHDTKFHLQLDDLPLVDKLKEVSTTIISRKFVHPSLNTFTCSVFIHDLGILKPVSGSELNNSIITAIYNEDIPYIFELIPKENHYLSSTKLENL